jgi:uncharacterized protein (TIGR02246 family)
MFRATRIGGNVLNRQLIFNTVIILVLSVGAAAALHAQSRDATVEERLQRLEDIEAIRSLHIDYGRALDKRDFTAYGKLFAEKGVWKGGMGSATGPEEIGKMVEAGFGRMRPEQYTDSNHVMTSIDIELDGDTATAWSRWLWVVVGDDNKPRVERAGHYEDKLVRENGQWKFLHRQAFTEINK